MHLTTKELIMCEKHASKLWHKYTDWGCYIHPQWLAEYNKKHDEILNQKLGEKENASKKNS